MKPESEVTLHPTQHSTSTPHGLAHPASPIGRHRLQRTMRVTLNLPVSLLDRIRNTVFWTPGLTLTGLITQAIQESLQDFEHRHGQPFPARLSELKSGRPRKRSAPALTRQTHAPMPVMRLPERPLTGAVVSPMK